MITIDASVWVSAGIPADAGHAESKELLSTIRSLGDAYRIIVPALLRVEIAAAITRSKNDPLLAASYSDAIGRTFTITWVDVDDKICQTARSIAIDRRLRAYDATYAAVALEYQCDLVSLDKDHLNRLVSVVPAFTPLQMISRLATL